MESERSYSYLERLKAALSPGLIALASLLLLGYVGLGETLRSYPALQHDRLAAQGEIIQKEINTFFRLQNPMIISGLKDRFSDMTENPSSKEAFLKLRELRNSW